MAIKIDKKWLRKELIKTYLEYSKNKEKSMKNARDLFLKYSGAEEFLDKDTYDAILYLETIGWDLGPKIDAEKIEEILKSLKNK